MEIKYNSGSQDVNVFLSREEVDGLVGKLNTDFLDSCTRGVNWDANAYFYLGSGQLGSFFVANAKEVTQEGGIHLINSGRAGDPYYIKLSPLAVDGLKKNGQIGMRMLGGSKLTIALRKGK